MTATLDAIRRALGATLAGIDGLEAHSFHVGSITPPAAVVMPVPGDFYRYNTAFDPTHDLQLVIGLFVQAGDEESASAQVDAFVSPESASSIWAAVEADQDLGGVVTSAQVTVAQNYGQYEYGGAPYYGCQFLVSVLP